jgi:hypothetical protein
MGEGLGRPRGKPSCRTGPGTRRLSPVLAVAPSRRAAETLIHVTTSPFWLGGLSDLSYLLLLV